MCDRILSPTLEHRLQTVREVARLGLPVCTASLSGTLSPKRQYSRFSIRTSQFLGAVREGAFRCSHVESHHVGGVGHIEKASRGKKHSEHEEVGPLYINAADAPRQTGV